MTEPNPSGYYAGFLSPEIQGKINNGKAHELALEVEYASGIIANRLYHDSVHAEESADSLISPSVHYSLTTSQILALIRGLCDRLESLLPTN